jgi:predicted DNA-binding protein (UPF0251 family)
MRLQYIIELLANDFVSVFNVAEQVLAIEPSPPAGWSAEEVYPEQFTQTQIRNAQLWLSWTPLPDSVPAVDDVELTLLRMTLTRRGSAIEAMRTIFRESVSKYRDSAGALAGKLFSIPESAVRIWMIDLDFLGDEERQLRDVADTLWAFAAALESIEGVTVYISEIRTGSIRSRLRIIMRDKATRDKVREILEKTRDGLVAREFDSAIASTDRDRSEADKLKEEAENLRATREVIHQGDEADRIRLLEIERLELDNQAKRVEIERNQIENSLLKLQVVKRATELMKKGLLQSEPLSIVINGQPFLDLVKGRALTLPKGSTNEIVEGEETSPEPLIAQTKL